MGDLSGVFEETRTVDTRDVRVYGWNYRTPGGHFEMGQMNYELWKWLDNGDVESRVHGVWRPGGTRNPFLIIGFRIFGSHQRELFYAAARQAYGLPDHRSAGPPTTRSRPAIG